jgi:aryl-alcohol dehydrogenase-like predicted oxidoreductase
MMEQTDLAGSFTLVRTSMTVNRMGYGAMQLAGPYVFGPPRDTNEGVAVLREAVESGVNHIDTSDYYGPHVTNQIIKRALHPYPKGLVIVTKIGARRGGGRLLDSCSLATGAHRWRSRQPEEPRPRRSGRGQSSCRRIYRTI